MAQTTVNVRMDEDLKKQVEFLCNDFGMNVSTAFTIFAKAMVRERKIPFDIKASDDDGFYNPHNLAILKESIAQRERGQVVIKTMEELEAMESE
jgi:DNA-damage-inducible protein J